ncbi:sensor domain-containing diguanylate cyclase [Brevibacillus agri]|nr:sensor domain-containing diguanylate cyclase [Brevibacillus agri]WHX33338.1 sensor domain-containing diguanylate cyclase [Brevibacillus agri]
MTARKEAERRQQQLLDIIEASPDFIATADVNGKTMYLNPAARQMLGIASEENVPFASWNPPWARELIEKERIATAIQTGRWKGETAILKQDGTETPVSQMIVAHKSENGAVQFFSTIARDISETKELEKKISHQALYDSLTDLPNRRFLHQRLSQLMKRAENEQKAALLFMDLDNFKQINDTLGHDFGDRLLQHIAIRLTSCLHEEAFICRYGGDEFIIVLERIDSENDIQQAIHRIFQACSQPIEIGGHAVEVTWSIGVSVYPDHGTDEAKLIKRADQKMYKAKRQGKNATVFY